MSKEIVVLNRVIRDPAMDCVRNGGPATRYSDLTTQEKVLSAEARVDLGAGYPHHRIAEWVLDIMSNPMLLRRAYTTMSNDTFMKYDDVRRGLLRSVCRSLGMDEADAEIRLR